MDPLISTGSPAPPFSLPDLEGHLHSLEDQRGRLVVLNFWSAECPWSARADRELLDGLKEWEDRVTVWAIAANANEPDELIRAEGERRGLALVLRDAGQKVADLYGARTTPHLFVIDCQGNLRYQGALDDVTFRKRTPSVPYLRRAMTALLSGGSPDPAETLPYGCTIVRHL